MGCASADLIARAHGRFGSAGEVVAQRRAVYRLAVELLDREADPADREVDAEIDTDRLDNPISRGHLGEVLSGRAAFSPDELRPLTELTGPVAGPVRVVQRGEEALAPALARVSTELRRHRAGGGPPVLLTAGAAGFAQARRVLLDGVEVALKAVPELAADLLPHVAAFAMVRDDTGRLGSASAREFPGLVVLPAPSVAAEAAEAFLHEGAHQTFFDLAITRAVFGANQFDAPPMPPSWAGGAEWPLEQTFAAWHAYRCLTAFAEVSDSPPGASLLPVAAERAEELGDWLRAHGEHLGPDGHRLLDAVDGRAPDAPPSAAPAAPSTSDPGMRTLRFAGRTLIARHADALEFFWREDLAPAGPRPAEGP
ncbi:hypothetical protein GCM10023321_66610 [Pseudonocardia eucalypti]|uniref:HEXXH motif-containing protein n=1 Tax=Pseudonocardia eucalypti TaxID=648755 RepID=A0ABP9R0Q3_9PSEU|nr:hypothetical protein [Pseudonocardia eucalypti]